MVGAFFSISEPCHINDMVEPLCKIDLSDGLCKIDYEILRH
jgi:hypothetical protein